MTQIHDPEVAFVRNLAEDVPPRDAEERARGRVRLLATIADSPRGRSPVWGQEWTTRRMVLRVAVPVTAAAVLAAGGVAVIRTTDEGPPPASRHPSIRLVNAAMVLKGAAEQEERIERRQGSLPPPRGDQYIYTRMRVERTPAAGGPTKVHHIRAWHSVDGEHANWGDDIEPAAGPEVPVSVPVPVPPAIRPSATYERLQRLPRDPDRLIMVLSQAGSEKPKPVERMSSSELDGVYLTLTHLLASARVTPPGLRATIFEAIGRIPDVRVRQRVDALGRPGIAVSRLYQGHIDLPGQMIFDAKTYEYLGTRTVFKKKDGSKIVQLTALERWGIADRLKQVPKVTYTR